MVALGSVCVASAQDSLRLLPSGLKLSGSADVYYKYNFNGNATDNKTSFTNSHNSFELGMVSLKLEHSFKNVSMVADVGFGKRAGEFSYNDAGKSEIAIKQLNISYAASDKVKFTIGSYATHVGYELVDAYANRNYSMSYMFSYGPFFHTGVKADFSLGNFSAMLGVFNPTDLKSASFTDHKYIGAQFAYVKDGPVKAYLNYIGGKDTFDIRNDQIDAVVTYAINSKFSLGYNGTYSTYSNDLGNWYGSALYLNYDPVEKFGLTFRTEYFSDKDKLKVFTSTDELANGGDVWSFTLSGNYRIGGFTLVPEFRLDHASEKIFSKKDLPKGQTANVLLAAIYKF
ncbi:putative OmpL-like beta-barrel porin-2 [Chitinophaga skermanii]|uniref:Putative OmpL-like beta-barrel porin-2 n=2 Tax=Chitinophaga skermanii TaxID=331697 RepID=A0A327QIZ8_9BACT|nr:putative OmpL-like beta-barrel porin-2 [Chitinophaga skermanii]